MSTTYILSLQKIRNKYETDKEKFKTLKAILEDELAQKTSKDDKSGTVGGLWLKRSVGGRHTS